MRLVAIAVIGGLGSLAGAVVGAVWVIGLPAFWPEQQRSCRCSRRASGCCIILLYIPGGFVQIGVLRAATRCCGGSRSAWARPTPPKTIGRTTGVADARAVRSSRAWPNADGTVLATERPDRPLRRSHRGRRRRLPRHAGRGRSGSSATTAPGSRRCSTRSAATCPSAGHGQLLGRDVSQLDGAPARPAGTRPHVPGRDAVPRAHRARDRAARARGAAAATSFWDDRCSAPSSTRPERRRSTEAARAHRLPRSRSLRRPVRRRALDRHPPHRRAGRGARRRAAGHLPRRADRGRGPTGGRGVRAADHPGPGRSSTPR